MYKINDDNYNIDLQIKAEQISNAIEVRSYVEQRRLAKRHGTMSTSSRFQFLLEDLKEAELIYTKVYERFRDYVRISDTL
jgi:hypothetical protein